MRYFIGILIGLGLGLFIEHNRLVGDELDGVLDMTTEAITEVTAEIKDNLEPKEDPYEEDDFYEDEFEDETTEEPDSEPVSTILGDKENHEITTSDVVPGAKFLYGDWTEKQNPFATKNKHARIEVLAIKDGWVQFRMVGIDRTLSDEISNILTTWRTIPESENIEDYPYVH